MPSAQKTTAYFYYAMYPELEETVIKLRAQKKPLTCYLPFKAAHTWSPSKNNIRYCLKCGKVDFYYNIKGMLREFSKN